MLSLAIKSSRTRQTHCLEVLVGLVHRGNLIISYIVNFINSGFCQATMHLGVPRIQFSNFILKSIHAPQDALNWMQVALF